MPKFARQQLKEFSLELLLDLLLPDFNICRTYFEESAKRYMVQHNYNLIAEVNEINDEPDMLKWETFGFDFELIELACTPVVYGSTAKECLLNFFDKHPTYML